MWYARFICDMWWCTTWVLVSMRGDVTHSCMICRIYMLYLSYLWRIYMWYARFICDMWWCTTWVLVSMRGDVTHSCMTCRIYRWMKVGVTTYPCVAWRILMWHDSFRYAMCEMTRLCVIWLIHTWLGVFVCGMTLSGDKAFVEFAPVVVWDTTDLWVMSVRHDSFMCAVPPSFATWLIRRWRAIWSSSRE